MPEVLSIPPDELERGFAETRAEFDDYAQLERRFVDYLIHERGRSEQTVKAYLWAIERVAAHAGTAPQFLTVSDLRAFMREAQTSEARAKHTGPYAKSTMCLAVAGVRQWHRWGVLEDLWEANALAFIVGPARKSRQARALSLREVRMLLDACTEPYDFRLVYPGLYAGLRIGESSRLDEDSWGDDRLYVLGKAAKDREVPLHPALAKVKHIILESEPLDPDDLQWKRRYFIERAGLFYFIAHQLRRTFATSLYDEDVPREIVGGILGHADPSVTGVYASVTFKKMAAAVPKLPY